MHMKTDSQSVIILQNREHSHPPDNDCSLMCQQINNTLKRKASEDINEQRGEYSYFPCQEWVQATPVISGFSRMTSLKLKPKPTVDIEFVHSWHVKNMH